ncbi:DNA repair protein RecO [Kamptonema cortianum]|uniref:DNA repair protein RecO n=1 Tax=Geitlerinema calcuttense NRMC-F 0142 TaxID=2922238 RepID=A0ABT7M0V6_9CYAN|nr:MULTISPECIES: DNA repair protein RecO [Cyanophyceae]MDK3161816.1 DNA repair protein RecO [Kamptonema cortianum]MDL5054387.1 DNA repair protein RecO [Oscillatoria laete-virens NRMC-F 0139]MDL5057888.1 DNA repair protein RecO [Geitlerinema calcuttense NRMC-F 0142]
MQTRGIIIRKYPLTESSLIIHWMTESHGRLKTAAKGARKPKNKFHGKLDLMDVGTLSWSASRQSDLHALTDFHLENRPAQMAQDLARLEYLGYAVELLETVSEIEIPHPELFAWLSKLHTHLGKKSPDGLLLARMELSLLKALGLQPEPDHHSLDPATIQSLQDWMRGGKLREESITDGQAHSLTRWTGKLIREALHRQPRSRPH